MSLRAAILAMLTVEKGSGYDLVKRFNQSIRYFWASSFQQIYRELQSLEDSHSVRYDNVEQSGKPDKKIYEVNPAGLEELRDWLQKPAKYTTLKEPLLIKIFAGALIDPQSLLAELDDHEQQHRKTLAEYRETEQKLLESRREEYLFPYQTLRLGIRLEEAWLAWCEDMKKSLPELYEKHKGKKQTQEDNAKK